MPRAKKSAGTSKEALGPATVGVHLEMDIRKVLEERATRAGVSRGALAKVYLLERLFAEEDRASLSSNLQALDEGLLNLRTEMAAALKSYAEGLQTIHQNIEDLRADFAFAVKVLLVSAGKVSKEKAKAWVDEAFSRD